MFRENRLIYRNSGASGRNRPSVRSLNAAGEANSASDAQKQKDAQDQRIAEQAAAAAAKKKEADNAAAVAANSKQATYIRDHANDAPPAQADNGVQTGAGSTQVSAETSKLFNLLEAKLQAQFAASSPEQLDNYRQTQTLLQQLAVASPDERAGLITKLQDLANKQVDEPINEKEKNIKQILQDRLSKLADLQKAYKEGDLAKLKNNLAKIDLDTAESLYNGLTDIDKRGGDASGLASRLAQRLIEGRGLDASVAQQMFDEDQAVKNARYNDQQNILQDQADQQINPLEDLRKANRQSLLGEEIQGAADMQLNVDQQSGQAQQPGFYDPTPTTKATASTVRSEPVQTDEDNRVVSSSVQARKNARLAAIRSGSVSTYNPNTLLSAYQ